jgi:hypothetical protein
MKQLSLVLMVFAFFMSCANHTPEVLLFMRNGSYDLEFMLRNEVMVMKDTMEKAGIKVVVATSDGLNFAAGSTKVEADIKLSGLPQNLWV